jgi:anti-anti-sigma regulatory factor
MNIVTDTFRPPDSDYDLFRIRISGSLIGSDSGRLRDILAETAAADFPVIYIDAAGVQEADLSGVNEIINAHYLLAKASKKLIFIYRKNTAVESWVATTGLDKFIETAIIP